MSILSRLQSQVTGREIDVSPTGQTARLVRQGREAIQGSVSNAFRAILPTAEEGSSAQAVQTPILTGTERQRQLESYAQLADDRRRSALETELYQLTQPGRVYNEETTARNRARVQEIENELSTLRPRQSNSRLRSGVQSILSSTFGALPAVGETVAQVGRNANAQANDPEYQSLSQRYSQLVGRMGGLERSYRGHEDYLYATEEWNALAREREEVLASLRARGTAFDNPVDVNSEGMRLIRESAQYQQQALEGLEGAPRLLGETALSIGQNAILLPTAAINPTVPLAAMGAISAANRMYELSERGLSASEALGRGLISGGIEAATEKIPLENLLSVVRTGGSSALRNVLRQAGIEAGEESVSYLANYLADVAAQDPEAEFSLQELARSAAGGALSGGVFGGAAMGINALTRPGTPQVELPSEPGQRVVLPRGDSVFSGRGTRVEPGQQDAASTGETGTYRAVTPENVELPTVPIINLSMQDVAAQNGGVLPRAGNTMRRDAISRARKRLGLDQNSAVYIPASNVTRNGEEYVLKITRASLNKMLSPARGGQIKPESIVVLDNIERIANNGVWFNSQGDRKGRQQVQGFDHLMTTIYIDGMPYLVDMRVKLVQEAPGRGTDNVLYYFTPEEILTIEKVGTTPPTGERRALTVGSEGAPTSGSIIPQPGSGVNLRGSESGAPLFQSESTSQGADVPLRNDTPLGEPEGSPTDAIIPTEGQEVNQGSSGQVYERAEDGVSLSAPVGADIPNPGAGPQYLTGPGTPRVVLPGGIDNPSGGGYDGAIQENRTGGTSDVRRETGPAARQGAVGADVRGEARGAEEAYPGRMGRILEESGGRDQVEGWARGHIVTTPSQQAERASQNARQYIREVFAVDDSALKARSPRTWALTSGGRIYISDSIPAELSDVVGYHEVVHAIRQQGNQAYQGFLSNEYPMLDHHGERTQDILDLVVESRFPGKNVLDLTTEEALVAYDELNALVWGYHKADPENARAQFSGVFRDYDAYIRELDAIMEEAAQTMQAGQTPEPGTAESSPFAPFSMELPRGDQFGGAVPNPGAGPQYLTGPESSVGGAREGFDPWSQFQLSRSEFLPEGANAARPVDVPTTDPQGRLIRRTASTTMGAKAIPDEAVADIQNMVLRGELSYTRKSDRAAIDRAVKTIQDKTYQGALEEFRSQVQKGVISKDVTALGQQLLINAANAGDGNTMAEVLTLYAQMETTAGQAVQAASILRKLSPSSQLYAAQRTVSDLEKAIQKRYKDIELTIDPALLEEFNQQTDQEGRNVVLGKIYQNVADQIPSNWKDKWNAWRYLAMLANPRTHVRNVAGNVFFQPLRIVKDRVAAAIEAGVSAAGGGKLQRTKSFLISPELYRAAWSDWFNVRDVLSGNKYDDIRSEINSRRRIFRFAPLEATRAGNSWLLEFEDSIFKRITYADALAGYLQANGVTAEQVRNNTVDAQVMSRARDYAGQEALRATYQDRNAVSDKVVEVARVLGPAGEAILPFKRTPANILVRGMEYSPAGLAKALTADLVQVRRGNMTGAEAIDHIASGLTGSALFALGAYLFAQGIVTSGGGDDENLDQLNELTGGQNYALNLPDGTNVTLDWLAPEALPFFMGVELMDSMGQNGNTTDSIMNALKSISDPMLELSMLQSLNDVIDSVSFSENKLGAMAASSVISYFTQAIPTIGGQIERSAEDVRMSTYTDKNLVLPTDIQYALGRASSRIPGWDYQQIAYIDAWGRNEENGPLMLRMGNNFLNPAYTSRTEVTPVDEEVRRLYNQTGNGGVVPDRAPRYFTVDGERVDLTAAQYTQYATERGQTQFSMLEELFDRPEYNALPISDKAALVEDVYEYADALAKAEVSSYEPDGWVAKAMESGVEAADYLLFRTVTAGLTSDKDENGESISGSKKAKVLAAIDLMDLSDEEKDALYYASGYSESTIGEAPWRWG